MLQCVAPPISDGALVILVIITMKLTVIVSLTVMVAHNCVMLKIKCDQYWPADSEPLFYGDLQVQILNETISTDWHITEMLISLVCVYQSTN